MSGEPGYLVSIVIMVLGVVALLASIVLQTKRKLPDRNFQRTTLLILGFSLTQVGAIAGRQEETKELVQVGLLALLLCGLAIAAFLEGWRGGGAQRS